MTQLKPLALIVLVIIGGALVSKYVPERFNYTVAFTTGIVVGFIMRGM